jgi:ketosteroid isomerase-like protein
MGLPSDDMIAPRNAGSLCRNSSWRIAENWIDAWNSHDVEKVLAIFTPDVLYEDLPFGVRARGSKELRAFALSIFAAVPDIRLELTNSSLAGGRGTIE